MEDTGKRWDEMTALRKDGKSFAQIARQYGISRQRVAVVLRSLRPKAVGRPKWDWTRQKGPAIPLPIERK